MSDTENGFLRSNDKGQTWSIADTRINYCSDHNVCENGDLMIQAKNTGTAPNSAYKSVDNGLTWNKIYDLDQRSIYFWKNSAMIYSTYETAKYSTDKAESWNELNLAFHVDTDMRDYVSFNDTIIYVNEYGVYFTENRGESWQERVNGIPRKGSDEGPKYDIRNIYEFNGRLFVIANYLVYYSDNYGEMWKQCLFDDSKSSLYQSAYDFNLFEDRHFYIFTVDGFYKSKTQSSVGVVRRDLPEITSISIAPNPSSDNFKCLVSSESSDYYSFGLYDINGNQVKKFGQRFLHKGDNSLDFTISDISNGCYFIRMTRNGMSMSTMLIVK